MRSNTSKPHQPDLNQVLSDLTTIKELIRKQPSFISYGFNHILSKQSMFEQYPLFGWQVTPNSKMNTRGPSMRFFTATEGNKSARLDDKLLYYQSYSHVERIWHRSYIFLNKDLNKESIHQWGKSLWAFGWGTKGREDFKVSIEETYRIALMEELTKYITQLEILLESQVEDPAENTKNNPLF